MKLKIKKHHLLFLLSSLSPTSLVFASAQQTLSSWSSIISLGYTNYNHMYSGDGQTPIGRLAIARNFIDFNCFKFGLEIGYQNGNTMRLDVRQETLDLLGGLPIQSTIKPMLDLLVTTKTPTLGTTPFFAALKGGIAYRRWQFDDRNSINDKSQIAGEVQAGLGYQINNRADLTFYYQGIYDGQPNFKLISEEHNGEYHYSRGHVSNIPIQNAVLLSLSFNV